jgi:hypothetical protein
VFLFFLASEVNVRLIVILFLAGAVGGVTNNYVRMKNMPSSYNEISDPMVNSLAIIQIYVTPIVAGVFGVVLYSLFLTDMLSGALFPNFEGLDEEYNTIVELFSRVGPKEQIDAAKAIVWAFIAGFSERFVPNILDKLAQEGESAANHR